MSSRMKSAAVTLFALAASAGLVGTAMAATKPKPARASSSANSAQIAQGKLQFARQCAACHGQGAGDDGSKQLPGTDALARKYKGELPPQLELRRDLNADVIRMFVRNGSGAMPMFRKSELTDADISAIAAYIADTSARAAPKAK
jgi:mono/diheme cytochrome c family protein